MFFSLEDFALTRIKAVRSGLEEKKLAALMIEKFAEGMVAANLSKGESRGSNEILVEADKFCQQVDSEYKENRRLRYKAVARLDLSEMKGG